MALKIATFRKPNALRRFWSSLLAAMLVAAVGWAGAVYAANNSVQGAKKEEGGFDGDAPTAILIEATSGSVLFGTMPSSARRQVSTFHPSCVSFIAASRGSWQIAKLITLGPGTQREKTPVSKGEMPCS